MARQPEHEGSKNRVSRHRVRLAAEGLRRVVVTVPAGDAKLVKAVAGALREGGDEARTVREAFASMTVMEPVRTGTELLAFLRAGPLVGKDMVIERDRTKGRAVDLGTAPFGITN